MASVNFLYRSSKEKSNLILRLLYRHGGEDFVFGSKTKLEVEKFYWENQHKKKSKDIEITNKQTEINIELNRIENHLINAFSLVDPSIINKDWVKAQMDYYYNPPEEHKEIPRDLISYIDYYTDYRKNEITKPTLKKINVIKNLLIRFETKRNQSILLYDVNGNFKNEFVDYCKSESYAQNTIQRAFVFIKMFCKHAKYLGVKIHHQLDGLKIAREKVVKIYLSFDDLSKIENIDQGMLSNSLINAKDWLVISCYTGQRISDFMKFREEQIRFEDGNPLIEFTQKKTGKNMTIPLHPKVMEILDKRKGAFPYAISDQKYNNFIKTICKIAGIDDIIVGSKMAETHPGSGVFRKQSGKYKKYDLVTSHIGRRSFATNFYSLDIPTSLLINITGHSTEAMFRDYIGKSSKDLAKETFKYFQ